MGKRGFVVLGRRWRCRVWATTDIGGTPQGRLRCVDFEDTGAAADQLLQTEDREVRFQTPEVGFAVKSSANVVLAQSAKKHRKAQESCISLASWE